MIEIYANLIRKGMLTLENVPESVRQDVANVLGV